MEKMKKIVSSRHIIIEKWEYFIEKAGKSILRFTFSQNTVYGKPLLCLSVTSFTESARKLFSPTVTCDNSMSDGKTERSFSERIKVNMRRSIYLRFMLNLTTQIVTQFAAPNNYLVVKN